MSYSWRQGITEANIPPEHKLALAIVGQAWEDLQRGPEESLSAFEWLVSQDGTMMISELSEGSNTRWDTLRQVIYMLDPEVLFPLNAIIARRIAESGGFAVTNEEIIKRVAAVAKKHGYRLVKDG